MGVPCLWQQRKHAAAHARLEGRPPASRELGGLCASVEHGGGPAHELLGARVQELRKGLRLGPVEHVVPG